MLWKHPYERKPWKGVVPSLLLLFSLGSLGLGEASRHVVNTHNKPMETLMWQVTEAFSQQPVSSNGLLPRAMTASLESVTLQH